MEQMKIHVLAPESVEECQIMKSALYEYMLKGKERSDVWVVQKCQQIIDAIDKMETRIERSSNWIMKRKMRNPDEMVIMKDGKATIVKKDEHEDQLDNAYISKHFDDMEKEQKKELKSKESEIKKVKQDSDRKEKQAIKEISKIEDSLEKREGKLESKLKDMTLKYEIEHEKLKEHKKMSSKKIKDAENVVKKQMFPEVSDDEINIPDINIVGDVYEGD